MPKLVCMLRVKDGILFVNEWLKNMEKLVDEIVVVDNGSSDGTYEILKDHSKVVDIARTEGYDEGRDKILVYEMARKRNPDWCLWLDVDEIFEDRMTRKKLNNYMNSKNFTKYWFRRFHFVDNNSIDGSFDWIKEMAGPDRILWKEQTSGYFLDYKINNGLIRGIRGLHYISHLRIKHLGYITQELIFQKNQLYREIAPNLERGFKRREAHLKNKKKRWLEYKDYKIQVTFLNIYLDIIFLLLYFRNKI